MLLSSHFFVHSAFLLSLFLSLPFPPNLFSVTASLSIYHKQHLLRMPTQCVSFIMRLSLIKPLHFHFASNLCWKSYDAWPPHIWALNFTCVMGKPFTLWFCFLHSCMLISILMEACFELPFFPFLKRASMSLGLYRVCSICLCGWKKSYLCGWILFIIFISLHLLLVLKWSF